MPNMTILGISTLFHIMQSQEKKKNWHQTFEAVWSLSCWLTGITDVYTDLIIRPAYYEHPSLEQCK